MEKRVGVVGIVVDDPKEVKDKVNDIISSYGHVVVGRMGIPRLDANVGVIALIVEGTTDDIGAMTGKLGNVRGVTVKSALTSQKNKEVQK